MEDESIDAWALGSTYVQNGGSVIVGNVSTDIAASLLVEFIKTFKGAEQFPTVGCTVFHDWNKLGGSILEHDSGKLSTLEEFLLPGGKKGKEKGRD